MDIIRQEISRGETHSIIGPPTEEEASAEREERRVVDGVGVPRNLHRPPLWQGAREKEKE